MCKGIVVDMCQIYICIIKKYYYRLMFNIDKTLNLMSSQNTSSYVKNNDV